MYVICDEMWNSVDIHGPQSEIDRFKRLFIMPGPANDWEHNDQSINFLRGDVYPCQAWNFREFGRHERGMYSFAFDTVSSFPTSTFEDLAELFPGLAFDCECIADDDRSMGYGWFNPPPGGDDFADDYAVPKGYWDKGGGKRTPDDAKRHAAVIAAFRRTLMELDHAERSS